MSDELKARLREILEHSMWGVHRGLCDPRNHVWKLLAEASDDLLVQIDQACKDAGYTPNIQTTIATADIRPMNLVDEYAGNGDFGNMMTGQEWFDRFEQLGLKEFTESEIPYAPKAMEWIRVLEVARRAAGLE